MRKGLWRVAGVPLVAGAIVAGLALPAMAAAGQPAVMMPSGARAGGPALGTVLGQVTGQVIDQVPAAGQLTGQVPAAGRLPVGGLSALKVPAVSVPLMRLPVPVAVTRPAGSHRPAASPARPANSPLSLWLGSGQRVYHPGAVYRYTVVLRNDAPVAIKDVPVVLALPASVTFLTASQGGVFTTGAVAWDADIPALGTDMLHAIVLAGQLPRHQPRVVAVACVQNAKGMSVMCAMNWLPARAKGVQRSHVAAAAGPGRAAGTRNR
jgi:uncharacterized repeat protein (TIGR01451 family)